MRRDIILPGYTKLEVSPRRDATWIKIAEKTEAWLFGADDPSSAESKRRIDKLIVDSGAVSVDCYHRAGARVVALSLDANSPESQAWNQEVMAAEEVVEDDLIYSVMALVPGGKTTSRD